MELEQLNLPIRQSRFIATDNPIVLIIINMIAPSMYIFRSFIDTQKNMIILINKKNMSAKRGEL